MYGRNIERKRRKKNIIESSIFKRCNNCNCNKNVAEKQNKKNH